MSASEKVPSIDQAEVPVHCELPFDEIGKIVPGGIIITNASNDIVYLNSFAEELLGYPAEEMTGRPIAMFLSNDLEAPHLNQLPAQHISNPPHHNKIQNQIYYGKHRAGHTVYLGVTVTQYQSQGQGYTFYFIRDHQHYMTHQKELVENQQRYWGLVESQNALVVRLDHSKRITYVNPAYCQLFGRQSTELLGTTINNIVHPDDLKILAKAKRDLQAAPHRTSLELRIMTVKGWCWIAWDGFALNANEIQAVGHDITERKTDEEIAIIERNVAIVLAQKSTLAEALPLCLDLAMQVLDMDSGGIYLTDPKSGDLILKNHHGLSAEFISKTAYVAQGTPRHQLAMQRIPIYQNRTQIDASKNQIAINEGVRSFASFPIQFNEKVIACLNLASHINDEIPAHRRIALENLALQLGNMLARFTVQDELSESQHQLQSMFDSLMDFVFVLDNQGCMIQVNQMVLKRLGYTREELIGQSVLKVHPPELHKKAWDTVLEMLAGRLGTCPLDLLTKEGEYIPVETKVAAGRWGNEDVLIGTSRDITERKKSAALIGEKTREIEDFFALSLELLCIADMQGNFIRVNEAWEQVLGYSKNELQKSRFLDFVHPEDLPATLAEIARLREGKNVVNFTNRYHRKDGSWRYIEWRSQPHGNLIYAAASDITEWKIAEDLRTRQTNLLAYRNQFEEILTAISTQFINLPSLEIDHQITDALKRIGEFEQVDRSYVFIFDETTPTISNTHEWCAAGIEPQLENLQNVPCELVPWWMEKLKKLEDVHIPVVADLPPEAHAEKEILEAQTIQSVLVVPLLINNTPFGFLGFDSVLHQRNWSSESILLIKMVGNILSNALVRRKMESDLRQSESQNRALVSAIPDLIFRLRPDGIIINFKASDNELLALPQEKLTGASIYDILDSPSALKAKECMAKALATGQVQSMEYDLKLGDAMHIFEARFKNSASDEVIAIVRDISEQARLEQMKSDFINRATHELRTPIATMLLMTNLIDGTRNRDEFIEYWSVLKNELNRERVLIENLLTVGRLENNVLQFHFKPVDLAAILQATTKSLVLYANEKSIKLETTSNFAPHADATVVQADETALTQVFTNLIGNAIKYTPAGGKVHIDIQPDAAGIIVSVVDTGIGIPKEDLPMLFNRFFRGANAIEEEIQGTGIGLFIVRSIIEKHRGKVQVTSELGKGSQFDVWLPTDKSS